MPDRAPFLLLVVAGAICVAGCREEGDIQISSLTFNGVEQVDKGALANALQTKKGSWIPWGRKRYFDRRAFEADLKRIEAFYRDRGFPDARVRSFDVKLNDAQDKVDITAQHHRRRADPRRRRSSSAGSTCFRRTSSERCSETLPLQPGRPLDRQLAIASRERALNVASRRRLSVRGGDADRRGGRPAGAHASTLEADARRAGAVRRDRHPGLCQRRRARDPPAADVQAGRSVHPPRDAREPAEAVRPRAVRVRQRRVARRAGADERGSAGPRSRWPKASTSKVDHRRRLRHRGAGARAHPLGASQLLRRRAAGRRRRQVVVARSRRPRSTTASRTSSRRTSRSTSTARPGRRPSRSIRRISSAGASRCATRRTLQNFWTVVADQRVPAQHDRLRRRCWTSPSATS